MSDALIALGATLVAVGVGLYSIPAGIIVAGLFSLALGYLAGKK